MTRSAASRSPLVLRTSALANIGYTRYARLLPVYVPVPCEVDPWDTPPPEVEELVGSAAS